MNTCPPRRDGQRRSSVRALPAALGLLLCAGLVVSCGGKSDGKGEPSGSSIVTDTAAHGDEPTSSATVTVAVAPVKAEAFTESVDASGSVVARTGHLAAMAAPAATRVTGVHVAVGSRVRRGDKLVSFETTAFDAAVTTSDAALTTAEQADSRARRLVDAGIAPRKDAEVAAAELAAAKAQSVNAHRARQLAVLTAPLEGVVTRMDAVLGANADVGQTLVELADTRSLDVLLVLSPALAAKVRPGQPVLFREGAATDADTIASGRVVDVSAVVDSSSRGVLVRVAVGTQLRTLRLGEIVYGQVQAEIHRDALVIPDDALVPVGDGFQVFVVDAGGKAQATAVIIGARNGHRVWISEGLKANDIIVTSGAYGVDDGATIVVKKSQP